MIFVHLIGNGVHQVGFAQAGWAVDKQRVICFAGLFGNCGAGSMRKFIGAADDEGTECIVVVGAFEGAFQLFMAACQFIKVIDRSGTVGISCQQFVFDIDNQIDIKSEDVAECFF